MYKRQVYVLIPVAVTGGIHLDGLLDTADALSSYQSRERKLEILKDSHAGAFAVITACCYFLASFGIWSELDRRQVLVLAGGFVLSRAMSGLGVAAFPCAKKTGTLAMFSDALQERVVMFCLYVLLFLSAAWMCILDPKLGTAAVAGGWLTFFWYFRMSMKQFSGITGDLAGFFVPVSYTHLDVYKRQALLRSHRIWERTHEAGTGAGCTPGTPVCGRDAGAF